MLVCVTQISDDVALITMTLYPMLCNQPIGEFLSPINQQFIYNIVIKIDSTIHTAT